MKLGISHHFFNKENRAESRVNKQTGEISNRWAFGAFNAVELTTEGIQKHILSGKAISVAVCKSNWRKEDNFISAQIYGLDFDNNVSVQDCLSDPFLEEYAFLTYATPSSTSDRPRSRVLFALDEPITDTHTYKRLWKRLAAKMKVSDADEQCKDAVRIFYGCKTDDYSSWSQAVLPISLLESFPMHPDEYEKPEPPKREIINIDDPKEAERLNRYGTAARKNILEALASTPDGMDIRHQAINSASMKLASFSKGGWKSVDGWESEFRSILNRWGRNTQEIESSIKGAYIKAKPMPLSLPDKDNRETRHDIETQKPLTPQKTEEDVKSDLTWRSSDESMTNYRNRLNGAVDPTMTPLTFPLKCLHKKGGFCVAVPPGVLIGVVGLSGGLKTSFLETITEMWRQIDEVDVLWWGIEWSWEKMADRAVQRMGTFQKPTPNVHQMMQHEIWLSEEASKVPLAHRHGRRMSDELLKNGEWATEQIEKWRGKCHYIEEVDIYLDDLLLKSAVKVREERAKGRNVRVAVFDYVQLLNLRGSQTESERITVALSRIKAFCIEEKLVGMIASQVTKTSAYNSKNGDNVLEAESGQNFRGDKFNLVFTLNPVYADKKLTNKAWINISKNSAGETGKVLSEIDPSRYKWLDHELEEESEEVLNDVPF